jgi:hypothetical protein
VSYGKAFDPDIDAAPFVAACKQLRCLNALRRFDVGMPLTSAQHDALSAPVVVDRLLSRHAHRLALQQCDYLGLRGDRGRDKVLVHWACAKVRASGGETDEAVRDAIRRRLAGVPGVSYADIAATADSAGRRRLATMLLDYEPRVQDQVPILLKMREGRLALEKALDSGDPELAYMCLMHLRRALKIGGDAVGEEQGFDGEGEGGKKPPAKPPAAAAAAAAGGAGSDAGFLKVVYGYPAAVSLLAAYARAADPELLLQLYIGAGRFVEAGHALLRDAYASPDLASRVRLMKRAAEVFREGERSGGGGSAAGRAGAFALGVAGMPPERTRAEAAFCRSSTEEQLDLLKAQAELEYKQYLAYQFDQEQKLRDQNKALQKQQTIEEQKQEMAQFFEMHFQKSVK